MLQRVSVYHHYVASLFGLLLLCSSHTSHPDWCCLRFALGLTLQFLLLFSWPLRLHAAAKLHLRTEWSSVAFGLFLYSLRLTNFFIFTVHLSTRTSLSQVWWITSVTPLPLPSSVGVVYLPSWIADFFAQLSC